MMPGKIPIRQIPVPTSADVETQTAFSELNSILREIGDRIDTSIIAVVAAGAGIVTVRHDLGVKPTQWRQLDNEGTASLSVTKTDRGKWTDKVAVFTASGAGTFQVEVMV